MMDHFAGNTPKQKNPSSNPNHFDYSRCVNPCRLRSRKMFVGGWERRTRERRREKNNQKTNFVDVVGQVPCQMNTGSQENKKIHNSIQIDSWVADLVDTAAAAATAAATTQPHNHIIPIWARWGSHCQTQWLWIFLDIFFFIFRCCCFVSHTVHRTQFNTFHFNCALGIWMRMRSPSLYVVAGI